ncbi:MmcQ/YjbR family DNA-binding protein [Phenylobacterium sp.]|uniref:MmcQ/YjbR family DNA-binding protein n=1 Tax=Phenylobacterium sp. TaxID=1871053 RepID=UPI0030F4765C
MLTCDDIRSIALTLPEAEELPHFDSTSFRVKGKIFATMGDEPRATLKLDPEDQRNLVEAHPGVVSAVEGYWGRNGWTKVHFAAMDPETLSGLMRMAWVNVAPKRLVKAFAQDA